MSIYGRKNGRWAVQVYDPAIGRSRQVGTYRTRKEAKAAEADAVVRSTPTGRQTVASFAAQWLQVFPRPKASTNMHNAERVKRFAEQHARRRIDSITVAEARVWAVQRPGELSALRAMFNDARKVGLLTVNPFAGLGIERGRGRRDLPSEWLTADDVLALEDTARRCHGDYGDTMAAVIRFVAETGVRPGEMYALERGDLHGRTCTVRRAADSKTRTVTAPKNGRARTVVLTSAARDAAERAIRFEGTDLVFCSPQGRQFWASSFNYVWNPVRKAAGRPTMAFYELRHYCATHLLELGLSPADVAVQLGQTDGGALVMSTYGHPSENAARARILAAAEGHHDGTLTSVADARRAQGA
jgi:integrase